jgi:hypothetical protein
MAGVYGAAYFTPAALDAAVRDFDRANLRRGRFAAAQLWKLTSINGRYIELGQLLAPFLGDVEAVIPYSLVQVYRHIEAFRLPTREQQPGTVFVPAWAEEVRGMPVRYLQAGTLREHMGRMPARATSRGYVNVRIEVPIDHLFDTAWMRRFRAPWPMVRVNGLTETHPALARLVERTAATNFAIQNNAVDQRARVIARRRRMAAQHGLQVDAEGRLIPDGNVVFAPNDSDSDV